MTEAEWLGCTDPQKMLEFLRGKVSERRARLFGCAGCRRSLHSSLDEHGRRSVEASEHYAERQTPKVAYYPDLFRPFSFGPEDTENQVALLRDIFGNPFRPVSFSPAWFRPVSFSPAWLTPAVRNLAQAAYDNRHLPSGLLDNTGLAVLADALEEAGCDNADILSHLRGPGPHVRGCWVLDLLLNKE